MTVYQELQLSSAGSKQLIKSTENKKEKWRHILIYNVKVYLTLLFCIAFITVFTQICGEENSIVGVVVLLSVLALRQVDFGIRTTHGIGVIVLLFAVLAAGPRLSNAVSPGFGLLVNLVCIFFMMVLGCHNIIMSNQSTFLLGYLLLQGYDVTGHDYAVRLLGLAAGMALCVAVFYKNHRNRTYRRTFTDLFREFDICSLRTQWYIRLTLAISFALFLAELLHFPRAMWIGIACMSVLVPFTKDLESRAAVRGPYNVVGCGIVLLLYLLLPKEIFGIIGMLGGICVGYSASYKWQTVFNTFGALAVAINTFGIGTAILLRITANIFGSLYTVAVDRLLKHAGAAAGTWLLNKEGGEAV